MLWSAEDRVGLKIAIMCDHESKATAYYCPIKRLDDYWKYWLANDDTSRVLLAWIQWYVIDLLLPNYSLFYKKNIYILQIVIVWMSFLLQTSRIILGRWSPLVSSFEYSNQQILPIKIKPLGVTTSHEIYNVCWHRCRKSQTSIMGIMGEISLVQWWIDYTSKIQEHRVAEFFFFFFFFFFGGGGGTFFNGYAVWTQPYGVASVRYPCLSYYVWRKYVTRRSRRQCPVFWFLLIFHSQTPTEDQNSLPGRFVFQVKPLCDYSVIIPNIMQFYFYRLRYNQNKSRSRNKYRRKKNVSIEVEKNMAAILQRTLLDVFAWENCNEIKISVKFLR